MEFLCVEGYTLGEHSLFACAVHHFHLWLKVDNFFFFLPGTKVKVFDSSPKRFIPLVPGFRSLPLWEAAIFMHHDFAVLEQVTYHTFKPPNILGLSLFLALVIYPRLLRRTLSNLTSMKLWSPSQKPRVMMAINILTSLTWKLLIPKKTTKRVWWTQQHRCKGPPKFPVPTQHSPGNFGAGTLPSGCRGLGIRFKKKKKKMENSVFS